MEESRKRFRHGNRKNSTVTMMGDSTISPSSVMKDMLDTIDRIRVSLGGLADCETFYEEVLASLPQFVVCGPQSAGKSSVIRRISGVALPEATTLCTRISTVVQIRRRDDSHVKVELIGSDGKIIWDESSSFEEVAKSVLDAQNKAIDLSQQATFVEKYTVQVHVSGKNRANVTLVDLPGFHTANDEDTKLVNAMVERYITMPGTLMLHVVRGDQDYGSMLGNDFVRNANSSERNRVTVLTHCDKLDRASSTDQERLQNTLATTQSISSQTFAVDGRAQSDEDENLVLAHVESMDVRVDVGVAMVSTHLEERMRLHLETQFPKAVDKLEEALENTVSRLEATQKKEPLQVLLEMVRVIENNISEGELVMKNKLRRNLEAMASSTQEFAFEIKPIAPDLLQEFKTLTADQRIQILYLIIADVNRMIDERGLRNSVHSDRQSIIAAYAVEFATHATNVFPSYVPRVQLDMGEFFDAAFRDNIPEIAKSAAARLRLKM